MIYRLGDRVPRVADGAWIAPSAAVVGSVDIAEGASVWFGAVLRGDSDQISVGRDSNIQDNAVLHTDSGIKLLIGTGVTVGHHVMLHGCTIEDGALIGIRAVVLNGARIGKECLVGAGSVVTENAEFPDGSLILGSPAQVRRQLSVDERAMLAHSARHYHDNARRFRDTLVQI